VIKPGFPSSFPSPGQQLNPCFGRDKGALFMGQSAWRFHMPPTLSSILRLPQQQFDHPFDVEFIRRLAYDLYQQHGRTDGHDLDDWLQAEAELSLQAFLADTFSRLAR
jgi:hypothetical protein